MLPTFEESKNESGTTDQVKAKESPETKTEETKSPSGKAEGVNKATGTDEQAEKFYWVRFGAKRHPHDTECVPLGVNGEILQIQREQKVAIPERFLEVARHAEYLHYTQKPGETRKASSKIRLYPFDVLGEATENDYLRMKREGTKELQKSLEQTV